jgi:hypothetical protein
MHLCTPLRNPRYAHNVRYVIYVLINNTNGLQRFSPPGLHLRCTHGNQKTPERYWRSRRPQ